MAVYDAERSHVTGKWRVIRKEGGVIDHVGSCTPDKCDGHTNSQEAFECWRQHILNTARFAPNGTNRHQECTIPDCRKPTTLHAQIWRAGTKLIPLCATHCDRDGLDQILAVYRIESQF